MQAIEHNGFKRDMEMYKPERLEAFLNDPKVKEVRVFRLQKGMIINIEGARYKVIAVRSNGKTTLKPTMQEA